MNYLLRRRAFVVVQEFPSLEVTKDLLTSKIQFIIDQYSLSLDSIKKQDAVSSSFCKSFLFCTDLRVKIAYTLIYLTNFSSLSWNFLKTFKLTRSDEDFQKNSKTPCFFIDTEALFRNSPQYFLDLLGLGFIDSKTWYLFNLLKSCSENVGFTFLNDNVYYEHKRYPVEIEEVERFSEVNSELNHFIGHSLTFCDPQPIIWNFLNTIAKSKQHLAVGNFLYKNKFDYESIRKDKNSSNLLGIKEYRDLVDTLSQLNSLTNICKAAKETSVFGTDATSKEIFKYCLEYFFSQENELLFDINGPLYSKQTFIEKTARAALWLELLLFMCENSISHVAFRRSNSTLLNENFNKACQIQLSILLDADSMRTMLLIDYASIALIIEKADKLKKNRFYSKYYAQMVDPFLVFSWK